MLGYVRGHVAEPKKAPLCGNSIATDRWFIARDMPELDAYLHYRMVDVSSIKELARRWYPRAYFASPAKHGGHRALADIKESVQELRYYREAVFVPQPGPDSMTAREIAARYTEPGVADVIRASAKPAHDAPVPGPAILLKGRAMSLGAARVLLSLRHDSATMVGVAQLVRAPGCGPGCRGFESPRSPHGLPTELPVSYRQNCWRWPVFEYGAGV